MGGFNSINHNHSSSRKYFEEKQQLIFYCQLNQPKLGPVQIFINRNLPMTFIMKVQYKFNNHFSNNYQPPRNNNPKNYQLFQQIQNKQTLQNGPLIKFFGYKKTFNCGGHCKQQNILQLLSPRQGIIAYWQYYNYTLKDIIIRRNNYGMKFNSQQIWHLVQIVCQGTRVLSHYHIYYDFKPDLMMITPQGKLKLFWIHLDIKNAHLGYFRYFSKNQSDFKTLFYFSPQQLEDIRTNNRNLKHDRIKCNTFSLGMIILYMILLKDPLENQWIYKKKYKIQQRDIKNAINLAKNKQYNQKIIQLLEDCLKIDPKLRLSLQNISQKYFQQFGSQNALILVPPSINGSTTYNNLKSTFKSGKQQLNSYQNQSKISLKRTKLNKQMHKISKKMHT